MVKKKLYDLTCNQLCEELQNCGLAVGGSKSDLVIHLKKAFEESGLNVDDFESEVGEISENNYLEDGHTNGSPTKQSPAIDMTAMLQKLTEIITKSSENVDRKVDQNEAEIR